QSLFAIYQLTMTTTSGANGSISPAGKSVVNYGGAQSYTITANTGYHVADVLVDGVSAGAATSYNFSGVNANHTIEASFAINTFSISATTGANGSISPSGDASVSYGGSQSYAITPDAGYNISDVVVDGVPV